MNYQGIFHQSKSNYCFAYNKDQMEVRIRTAKNDMEKVYLIHGDKYAWDEHEKVEMEKRYSDHLFDYYITTITTKYNRLAYYFELVSEGHSYYYTEWGPLDTLEGEDVHGHFFHYPYINETDVHVVPDWVKDAVFYQLFPERFNNGDPSISPENVEPWGGEPKTDNFFGGDLRGIIDKVDYLVELGINAIYMTPIFESSSNHKYNTIDYFKIDPHFGDKETLKELVKKCHDNGIKVVLDAVFNHSGDAWPQFQDVMEKGEASEYKDWFHVKEFPVCQDPINYHAFAFEPYMPKLNTGNDEVVDYLCKVGQYWIEECDIDGWRLDVANEIDHRFWRKFREAVLSVKKDAYIVGEIWHESLPWLLGDQYDAVMNYPVTKACVDFFAKKKTNIERFKEMIGNTIIKNTTQVNEVMLNLLDSHDTARFITISEGNKDSLRLAEAFLLTFMGATSIYYGTEIGMEGGHDPGCRKTMEWDREKWDMDLFRFYQDIIKVRKEEVALRRGTFKWSQTVNNVLAYIREYNGEMVKVFINNSPKEETVTFGCHANYENLLETGVTGIEESKDSKVSFTMAPYTVRILKAIR